MRLKVSLFINFILIFFLLLQAGCGKIELTEPEVLAKADTFRQSGQLDQAIVTLESYNELHPGTQSILEALAFDYSTQKDGAMAAYYFIQLAKTGPEQSQFMLMAGQSLLQSGDKAGAISYYRQYLETHPNDAKVWGTLGRLCQSYGKPAEAIDALLKAYEQEKKSSTALLIANLFLEAKNLPQSKAWYQTAYKHGDKNQSDVLLGMLRVALTEKKFSLADSYILTLDSRFPGKLDHSDLAYSRDQIKKWKERKAALESATQKIQVKTPDLEAAPKEETPTKVAEKTKEKPIKTEQTEEAKKEAVPEGTDEEQPEKPIETEIEEPEQIAPQQLAITEPTIEEIEQKDSLNFRDCIIVADASMQKGDRKKAIRYYKRAIKDNDSSPDLWLRISKAYFEDGQFVWAESTALEAVRRDSQNPAYYIHYLKVAERSMTPDRYMRELQRVRSRFKSQPDITLALARAYKDIAKNKRNAAFLYKEFLDMAPDHPEAKTAREELEALNYKQ
jgi:tetratricopeptide (TPR) repeat protein